MSYLMSVITHNSVTILQPVMEAIVKEEQIEKGFPFNSQLVRIFIDVQKICELIYVLMKRATILILDTLKDDLMPT